MQRGCGGVSDPGQPSGSLHPDQAEHPDVDPGGFGRAPATGVDRFWKRRRPGGSYRPVADSSAARKGAGMSKACASPKVAEAGK